jgi:MraZ protein
LAVRFRGESQHKVDAKGRVSIPASFRRVLERADPAWREGMPPNLVIVYGPAAQKYLECYTIEAIDEVDDQIASLIRGTPKRQMLERMFYGQSHPTNVDETGRLVLPQKLREKIGLTAGSEAYFLSTGDTFQIWNPKTFAAEEAATADLFAQTNPNGFHPLALLDEGGALE